MNAVVLVAAGSGTRLKNTVNKPYLIFSNKYVISYSLETFLKTDYIDKIVVVYRKQDKITLQKIINKYNTDNILITEGGSERYNSVSNGLKKISDFNIDKVFIHDAARPFISIDILNKLYAESKKYPGVIPVITPSDTVKMLNSKNFVDKTINRDIIRLVQTPQVFDYKILYELYNKTQDWTGITDDSMIFEIFGYKVKTIEANRLNFKITNEFDLITAESISKKWN